MKRYRGRRTGGRCAVEFFESGIWRPLPIRLDLATHSPTGFAWGYGGCGPAQLAIAILAHCIGDEAARRWHQHFKWAVVAKLPNDGWELSGTMIADAMRRIEAAASKEVRNVG